MMSSVLNQPAHVEVEEQSAMTNIDQLCYRVAEAQRDNALAAVLSEYQPQSAIVFCNTRVSCHEVTEHLLELGF
jgi:ATP-independent RNA helicase DbpA